MGIGFFSGGGGDPERNSGIFGYHVNFYNVLPDIAVTSTNGGASVTSQDFGANVDVGSSSGDRASIELSNDITASSMHTIRTYVMYDTNHTSYADRFDIGAAGLSPSTAGAYLDLKNEQYGVGSTTTSATIPPSFNENALLIINQDIANGETTFEQRGSVTETKTIPSHEVANDTRVVGGISNGNGESVNITWTRKVFFAEAP